MNIFIASYSFQEMYKEGKMDVFNYLETTKYRYGLNQADLWKGAFQQLIGHFYIHLKKNI